jgi:hypothetical protein
VKDPTVRMDGKCRQCKGPRIMPRTHHRSIDASLYALDPFCSSQCARLWHGVEGHVREAVVCTGCGCEMENSTPGCVQCQTRERGRRLRIESRIAA